MPKKHLVLRAKTGAELLKGAKSLRSAMKAAGYSHWTSHNPAANGITPGSALAAAREMYPEVEAIASRAERLLKRSVLVSEQALGRASESQDPLVMVAASRGASDVASKALEVLPDRGEAVGVTPATLRAARAELLGVALRAARAALRGGPGVVAALEARFAALGPVDLPRGSIRSIVRLDNFAIDADEPRFQIGGSIVSSGGSPRD